MSELTTTIGAVLKQKTRGGLVDEAGCFRVRGHRDDGGKASGRAARDGAWRAGRHHLGARLCAQGHPAGEIIERDGCCRDHDQSSDLSLFAAYGGRLYAHRYGPSHPASSGAGPWRGGWDGLDWRPGELGDLGAGRDDPAS